MSLTLIPGVSLLLFPSVSLTLIPCVSLTLIPMGYSIIVLSGVCDVGSENHSKISGHMTSGERESLIPVSAGFWREL